MRAPNIAALAGSLLAACGSAGAADFAMMETAERIADGTLKLSGFPVLVDRAGPNNESGLVFGLGYGLPNDLDVEGHVARYEHGTFAGADLEWTAWREARTAFSVTGGLHRGDLDGGGSATGIDGTLMVSYTPVQRLVLSAALDAAYDDVNGRGAVPAGTRFPADGGYETLYAVPGIGYLLTRNIDLLAEVGVGLNGDSDHYVAGGMSWYFR